MERSGTGVVFNAFAGLFFLLADYPFWNSWVLDHLLTHDVASFICPFLKNLDEHIYRVWRKKEIHFRFWLSSGCKDQVNSMIKRVVIIPFRTDG